LSSISRFQLGDDSSCPCKRMAGEAELSPSGGVAAIRNERRVSIRQRSER
jgi:hypothetical protein